MILDTILAHKRVEIAQLDPVELRRRAADTQKPLDFLAALRPEQREDPPRLIAEIKRASPSRGVLFSNVDPVELAGIYAAGGAAAISVLTDQKFFYGSIDILRRVRAVCALPLLRKDFIIDPAQVYEARAIGADAILLIVAALPIDSHMCDLHALALELGLTPLVEVHNRAELDRALRLDPKLIGINNRDLQTFTVSLATTAALRPLIREGTVVVSESGISTPQHMDHMAALSVDAVLVGEALVTAPDIGAKVRELTRQPAPVGAAEGIGS